jgi:signal transduction histidine kinase
VDLQRDLPESMPPVECDVELMKVALVNYLSNGVKYGRDEDGSIRLTVRCDGDGLRVSVWNAGPGFPPGQRQNLFRKFSRLSLPEFRDRKGTGVGLFAVWQIARLHGGSCEATSQPGQWACFELSLPQPLAESSEA